MTHEELLEKIRVFLFATALQSIDENFEGTKMLKALHAVVELHYEHIGGAEQAVYCYECTTRYPCPTIQAIDKELK